MSDCFQILVMPGDGIGLEITAAASQVLHTTIATLGIAAEIQTIAVGKATFAASGRYLPECSERLCGELARSGGGAILFGAVESEPIAMLRLQCDLFANLRPLRMMEALVSTSRLRPEVVRGTDILIVRELVSGLYYGAEGSGVDQGVRWASQEMRYDERQIRRIVRIGLQCARQRRRKLVYVHKENAIPRVFGLWAAVLAEEAQAYPDVSIEPILVDNMAMQLVLRPTDFDVVLCENMFGDILSDLGAGVLGSIGMCPSASVNEHGFGLYESIGGCAPDIAGNNVANPISTILSAAMMFRMSLEHETAARLIEAACEHVMATHRTAEIWRPGYEKVGTDAIGQRVAAEVRRLHEEQT